MTQDVDPNVLHDAAWAEGETVTLRQGNKTWVMMQRANTAMSRAAIAACGLSPEEIKSLVEDQGSDALQELIDPLIDPVIAQLFIMRAMIVRWTLPWPLTPDGLEQLPEEYGTPIWAAIEARKPAEVPRTPAGDFPQSGAALPAGPVPLAREPGDTDQGTGSVGAQSDGMDVQPT